MPIFNSRENFSHKVEDTRLTSDNYNAYIIYDNESNKINLSDYGLKSINWDSRDELIVRKACTMKEEFSTVRRLGFDVDFRFEKNSSDLMLLFLDQTVAYLDGMTITKAKKKERESSYTNIGVELRTELKFRSKVVDSGINSVFSPVTSKVPTSYLSKKFDLLVNVQHFNGKIESYKFKNGLFYKPSQSTSENSSAIEEGIKAFFPYVEIVGKTTHDIRLMNIMNEHFGKLLASTISEKEKGSNDRIMVNPDNRSLLIGN